MDRLYRRYADPFSFMNGMMKTGRFSEFVDEFIQTTNKEVEFDNKEKEMRVHWELFLHRVFDRSFKDYMDGVETINENKNVSERTMETVVKHSMDILNNFTPEKGGES